MKKILLLIVLVVLVSGCSVGGFDFFKGSMGTPDLEMEENEIIKVQNMQLIGEEPILKNTPFTLYFEIQNMHHERDVDSVQAYLSNWKPCEIESINDEPSSSQYVQGNEPAKYDLFDDVFTDNIGGVKKIPAGGVEAVEIDFNSITPTIELPGKCNIQYMIDYNFDARTSFSGINIIDSKYLTELRRAGQIPESSPTINVGIGPLKIMFETDVPLPIEASGDVERKIPLTMWIENRGMEVFGDINVNEVILQIPEEFWGPESYCDRFEVDGTTEEIGGINFITLTNKNEKIPMIKGVSSKMRCNFFSPDIDNEKEYFILAEMNYDYRIRGEKTVGTRPS